MIKMLVAVKDFVASYIPKSYEAFMQTRAHVVLVLKLALFS